MAMGCRSMAADTTRLEVLKTALSRAAAQQGVVRVADLDFGQLAVAVEAVLGQPVTPATSPLDPEGDGLTPREINAANDV
jgi:hypothetical protein